VDLAEETARVNVRQAEAVEYHQVVARWNSALEATPGDTRFDFFSYCDFLLRTYDQLASGEVATGGAG
jgi:hypothetical protein